MSELDPAAIAQLRAMLALVPELSHRRAVAMVAGPASGSLAAQDLALPDGRYVTIFAGQVLMGALDDLNAWRLLAAGSEFPIRAHLILLRAAMEAGARARWFVDPNVDAGVRVGRALAARRNDQSARERLAELDDAARVRARRAAGVRAVKFTVRLDRAVADFERYRLGSGEGPAARVSFPFTRGRR